jgi:hypothetical protein
MPTALQSDTSGLLAAWVRFWFRPADPISLHILRVLGGLLCLAWLLPMAGHLDSLFGLQGWMDEQAFADLNRAMDGQGPAPAWSALYLARDNPGLLTACYWSAVVAATLFTLGLFSRITGVLTWLAMASFMANPFLESDGDVYILILAFYLMIGYLLVGLRSFEAPPLSRVLGPAPFWVRRRTGESRPSLGANLALRLLQVHFAIAMVFSGLHKLQSSEWWAGTALWFPLYPPLATTLSQAREHANHPQLYMGVLSAAAYAVLAWQLLFPLFAWRRKLRPVLLVGGAIAWLGSALIYGLPLLGPATLSCCLAYVTPEEWRGWLAWLAELRGRGANAEVVSANSGQQQDRVPVRQR